MLKLLNSVKSIQTEKSYNVVIVRSLSCALALVFLVFGGLKLQELHGFVESVENFRMSPWTDAPLSVWLAYTLIPLEMLVGAALLTGIWRQGAALLSLAMTVSFMVAIGSVWARGLNIDCGCSGGEISLGGYPTHMAILAAMLAVNVYLIIELLFPNNRQESAGLG